jgi:hypothetical protein
VQLQVLGQFKNPVTLLGIKCATFLVVAYVSTNFATMCFCGGISVEKMQGLAS